MPCLCVHVLLYERCPGQGSEEVPLGPGQLRHVATLAHLLRPLLSCAWCGTRRLCHLRHIPRTEQDVVVWWFLIKCWQFSVDNVQIIRLHNLQCSCSFTWLIILDNVANYEYVLWTLTVCRYTIRYCMSAVCYVLICIIQDESRFQWPFINQ